MVTMGKTLKYGRAVYHYGDYDPNFSCSPAPVMRLRHVQVRGTRWAPELGDRTLMLLLRRKMPKEVSFTRAYTGWREGGSREESELGEGRAFLRWLQRHELGIKWERGDVILHPYFLDPKAPRHDPTDETAKGLSFAIAPVEVNHRRVKLYVQDEDVLRLIHSAYGVEKDFLQLVKSYIQQRHQWQKWQAPAPGLVDWLTNLGMKPVFSIGQLGFSLPAALG